MPQAMLLILLLLSDSVNAQHLPALRRAVHSSISRSHANQSSCDSTLSPARVCKRCASSSPRGKCSPRFAWSWNAPLSGNDQSTSLPGLRAVRGIDALDEPGVTTLARWNQSNWPGLLSRTSVQTASEGARRRMCELWRAEHSYQSFPVMLRCPGFKPREDEGVCANMGAVVEVRCALLDLAAPTQIMGDVYDEERWFRASHWMHPPEPCNSRQIISFPKVASALSVNPGDVGHFVPEQLPALLVLHALLPAEIPILAYNAPVVRRYLQPLFEAGVMRKDRIFFIEDGPKTIRADSIFLHLNSHFSNVMSGDLAMKIARNSYASVGAHDLPRDHVILISRPRARSIMNTDAVITTIKKSFLTATGKEMRIIPWRPSNNMSQDIETFRHAALIVAPHGAGLSNMLFATEGTPVIEICFDSDRGRAKGMFCPAMYAAMALNLNLPYWVVTAHGTYTSSLQVDLDQLSLTVEQALQRKKPLSRSPKCNAH